MNAIISLCHFCEVHGPSVLFCTQAFHSHNLNVEHIDHTHSHCSQGEQSQLGIDGQDSKYNSDVNSWNYAKDGLRIRSPSVRSAASDQQSDCPATPMTTGYPKLSVSEACEACRPFSLGHPGFVSTDHEAKVSYVTTQQPDHPQVFTMIRQACVRSLSCEVCPGREGPIFFGDETQGHVFSHTFFIKDAHARGLQRWYSITVIMMDKIFLLNSWLFLLSHIRKLIEDLQSKADKVYEEENPHCPQRHLRLSSVSLMTHGNFRLNRGGIKPARSLVELTNDKLVFHRLHQKFTWILKAGGNRLTERLLEGPPTEDSIIDLEKQEENEDGFVVLHKVVDAPIDYAEEGTVDPGVEEVDDPAIPHFKNLRHVLKVLGYQRFHQIAHHVIIGNQVIVMCKHNKIIHTFIDCLKVLLPKGCCRIIYHSAKYEDSWRCNFLGLLPGVELPMHADHYVLMEIQEPQMYDDGVQPPSDENFVGYSFRMTSTTELSEKGPTVLNRMEFAMMNETLADSVIEECVTCLKEEWMNKVKVLFKFTKAGGSRSEDDTRKLFRVVGAKEEDKVILQFWMTGLSVQYRNHMLSSAIGKIK